MLEIKLRMFKDLLGNYGCSASMREAFLGLLASGVPTSALAQYLESNGSEAQRTNLYRLQKGLDDKCAAVEGLLRDQVCVGGKARAATIKGCCLLCCDDLPPDVGSCVWTGRVCWGACVGGLQIAQVAEMVVFRASKLRGLALLGGDFKVRTLVETRAPCHARCPLGFAFVV